MPGPILDPPPVRRPIRVLLSSLRRFFSGQIADDRPVDRIYVVAGVIPSGYVDPPYPTDPQHYGFPVPAGGKVTYKAFTDPADALHTIGEGRLAVVSVYVRKQGLWVFQEVETNRLMLGL